MTKGVSYRDFILLVFYSFRLINATVIHIPSCKNKICRSPYNYSIKLKYKKPILYVIVTRSDQLYLIFGFINITVSPIALSV